MATKKLIKPKLYVVQKLVHARSAKEAIRLERDLPCETVWIEEEWRKNNINEINLIGFTLPNENS